MPHAGQARGRPVFLDRSGRRRRLVLTTGAVVGVVLVGSLGLLAAGLSGASPTRQPGFPDAGNRVEQATPGPARTSPAEGPTAGTTEQVPTTIPAPGATVSAEATSPRRIPTHTPSHPPKPTKTN